MNITLYYFSGTGNTKIVCARFKENMESRNVPVSLVSIESLRGETPISERSESGIIGFAYPVYGADLPEIYKKFLQDLDQDGFNGKSAFAITTAAYVNAYGPFLLKKELAKKGLVLKNHIVVKMPDSTKTRIQNKNGASRRLDRQNKRIGKLADNLIHGRSRYRGVGPWLLGGYIVRPILKKPLREKYKTLYVDENLCTRCETCVRNCPTKAIRYSNGTFTFTDTCTTCFRCIHSCPVRAIKETSQ